MCECMSVREREGEKERDKDLCQLLRLEGLVWECEDEGQDLADLLAHGHRLLG